MKYLLDFNFNILCSDNFLIPKLNRQYDYCNNKIINYKIDSLINKDEYIEITKEEVEEIRSAYFSSICPFLSKSQMNWIDKYQSLCKEIDLMKNKHIKASFYHLYLLGKLINFSEELNVKINKKFLEVFLKIENNEKRKEILLTIENSFKKFIDNKNYWYFYDNDICSKEIDFFSSIINDIKQEKNLNYNNIDAQYLSICGSGIIHFNYTVNKQKSNFTKGLSLNDQKEHLILIHRIILTKLGNELTKKFSLNPSDTRKFKLLYSKFEKILLLSIDEWE